MRLDIKHSTSQKLSARVEQSVRILQMDAQTLEGYLSELMLENRDFMLQEMDVLLKNLTAYRDAIANDSFDDLRQLLDEGRRIKAEVDGR